MRWEKGTGESIQGIATDAASDKFRAMGLASGTSESIFIDSVLFPNVVLHAKDPTHASGRFLKVWKHDPFLNGVFDLLVWGEDSMAKLIENSEDISRRFAIRVKMQESSDIDGRRIKNMKFVEPRFNSAQAPLARAILFFDAVVGLAVELSAVRSGDDPARISQLFLGTMNEEKLIQAAMMADAGDESIQLTRLFDAGDSCQLASMPADLHNFVETVNYLFVGQPAGCLKSGYTAVRFVPGFRRRERRTTTQQIPAPTQFTRSPCPAAHGPWSPASPSPTHMIPSTPSSLLLRH